MNSKTSFFLAVLCILSVGCASFSDRPTTVIMKNPQTMEFVNCNVDKWGTTESYEQNDKCVKDYEAKGYVVWGQQ